MKNKRNCVKVLFFLLVFMVLGAGVATASVTLSIQNISYTTTGQEFDLVFSGSGSPGGTWYVDEFFPDPYYPGHMLYNRTIYVNSSQPTTLHVAKGPGSYIYQGISADYVYWTGTAPHYVGVIEVTNSVDITVSSGIGDPDIPSFNENVNALPNQDFTLSWSSGANHYIYELVEADGWYSGDPINSYWPTGTSITIPGKTAGDYYFRVRAWNQLPENGGRASGWDYLLVTVAPPGDPVTPVLTDPSNPESNQDFTLNWTHNENNYIYEVWEDDNADFSSPEQYFWPTGSSIVVPGKESGTYYYRVRAWNQLPENGGISSNWSNAISVDVIVSYPDLTVDGNNVHVISEDSFYNTIFVKDNASLVINNGATVTLTGELNGRDQSSFLLDNGTVIGKVEILSSAKVHLLNGTLSTIRDTESLSVIYSDNIVLCESTIDVIDTQLGDQAGVELRSPEDIYISNSTVSSCGGVEPNAYSAGNLLIESNKDIYIDTNSVVKSEGAASGLTIRSDVLYAFNSLLEAKGRKGWQGTITLDADELNISDSTLNAFGGEGVSSRVDGSHGKIEMLAKTINLADSIVTVSGGDGLLTSVSNGGDATLDIVSSENQNPSLYNNTIALTEGLGANGGVSGYTYLNIDPLFIDGALASTVRVSRKTIEDFRDGNLNSSDTTMFWWDWDGTTVYQHLLVDYFTKISPKGMKTDFSKQGYEWSLFGGAIDATNQNKDFSQFNTIRVWCKGYTDMLVKLRDRNLNEADLSTQSLNTAGEEIACLDFNYSHVSNLDLTDIDNVLFFAAPGDGDDSGTFYIDGIELVNTQKLENFEDADLWSPETTFGWWDVDGTDVYQHTIYSGARHEGSFSMKTDFDKAGRPWSCFGAFMDSSNVNKDFSKYRKFTFWLMGNVDILIKLRDRTLAEVDIATVTGVGGFWKLVEVDFSDCGLILDDVDNILFFAAPGDDSATGTFYIDDLQLKE